MNSFCGVSDPPILIYSCNNSTSLFLYFNLMNEYENTNCAIFQRPEKKEFRTKHSLTRAEINKIHVSMLHDDWSVFHSVPEAEY